MATVFALGSAVVLYINIQDIRSPWRISNSSMHHNSKHINQDSTLRWYKMSTQQQDQHWNKSNSTTMVGPTNDRSSSPNQLNWKFLGRSFHLVWYQFMWLKDFWPIKACSWHLSVMYNQHQCTLRSSFFYILLHNGFQFRPIFVNEACR